MSECLIIGLGGIGRWHAKSFSSYGYQVSYIDPAVDTHEYQRETSISAFGGSIIVISTTASHRWHYIELIERHHIGVTVVLEKPMFTSSAQHDQFGFLPKKNHYLLNLPFERHVDELLRQELIQPPIKVTSTGNSWGLACNLLHDLSLIGAFYDELPEVQNIAVLDLSLRDSKRRGYLEVIGGLQFQVGRTIFHLTDSGLSGPEKKTILEFAECSYELDFFNETCKRIVGTLVVDQWFVEAPKASAVSAINTISRKIPNAEKYLQHSNVIYNAISTNLGLANDYPFT